MRAILFDQAYQAESASETERQRHGELFSSSIVAFRLKTTRLDVEPHTGGFSLKTAFSGSERYEFGDAVASVAPGDVMLVRQNETYRSSIRTPTVTDSFSLFFPYEFYERLSTDCRHRTLQRFVDSGASNASFPVSRGFTTLLQHLAAQLERPTSSLMIEELVARLREAMGMHVEDVTESYSKITMSAGSRKADRLRRLMRAREMIHFGPGDRSTLAELAYEAGMSEFHFLRSFAEAFGTTPSRYLERIKIGRARDLLVASRLSVKSIADRSGYESVSAFCRAFRRATGMTPRIFRLQHGYSTLGE